MGPHSMPALSHPPNRIVCGVWAVSLASACLTIMAASTASAIEPDPAETPAPTPGDVTPIETPSDSPIPTVTSTPPSPTESATPTLPADQPAPGQTPPEPSAEAFAEDSLVDGATATETPTPTPSPSPSPSWGKVNEYWLVRARAIAIEYWLGDFFVRQMKQESGFNDDVITGQRVSSAGAEGIAQIMRKYHPGVDPLDPEAALTYAARHMQELLWNYDGNVRKALAAYNAGAIRVDQAISQKGDDWLSSMPDETQLYIAIIMRPDEPAKVPHWDALKLWWIQATEALGQSMHLRLLLGSMVSVRILPTPPEGLVTVP
jgi:hypothetical protein